MGRTLSSFRLGPACHLSSPPPSSPSLAPPTLTLVKNPALLHAAFDNAGASKRTRRLLRERLWLVEDSPSTAAAAPRLAALLSHAYPPPPVAPPPPHEHTGQRSGHAAEYFSHFAPRGYAIGGAELREAAAASLLGLLGLQSHDTFVDLGAATGRLALAAAWLTAARVVGVELSPSRHRQGEEALARLREEAVAARLQLRQGDLLEAPLDGATVVWCAVRPLAGRRLSMQLLQSIRRSLPAGRKVKLLLAGFELPPSAPAELRAGYLFTCADATPPLDKFGQRQVEPPPSADLNELGVSQLYGGPTGGPSVVLEYEVRAELDSDLEPASAGEKKDSGAPAA